MDLLAKRKALYAAIPNQIDTTSLPPDEVVRRIEALYLLSAA